jgi:ferredoxin
VAYRSTSQGRRGDARGNRADPRAAGTHRIMVNPIMCEAHGVCVELLPEMIGKDPWGYPIVSDQPIPPHLLKLARKAESSCPTIALIVARIGDPGR